MTGVIYARYSSDNQREESIEGQIRENTAFAEKNGIRIIEHYIDRAISAKTDNRPEFQRMIKDSAKKKFDVVIVWKLDRFSRNRYDSAKYKAILKKNDVKVISATETISEGAEGIILESVLEGMAEYYSADLSEKIKRGMTENALKCKYNGCHIPLGFRVDEEQYFHVDEEKAPIVVEIYERYAHGETTKSIANIMKAVEMGIVTKTTKARLEELEAEEDRLETEILTEENKKPQITKEQILFTLDRFRSLDLTVEKNRERLIDSFVKSVILNDDHIIITTTFKNEPLKIMTKEEVQDVSKLGSDIKSLSSPYQGSDINKISEPFFCISILNNSDRQSKGICSLPE